MRRSVEKKRNWTRRVSGIVLAVIAALSTALWKTNDALIKTEQKRLEANYNLAKAFEEKAQAALDKAEEDRSNESYHQVVLFTSAALGQEINTGKYALKTNSKGKFFAPDVFNTALAELWRIPVQKDFGEVIFSPDGKIGSG